jgi:hypothetical protein
MLTLNVTNRIIMKITVWLIPTRQRFDNCLLKKFNYRLEKLLVQPVLASVCLLIPIHNNSFSLRRNFFVPYPHLRLRHYCSFPKLCNKHHLLYNLCETISFPTVTCKLTVHISCNECSNKFVVKQGVAFFFFKRMSPFILQMHNLI